MTIITAPVPPSFEPNPDEVLIGTLADGLMRVYASRDRVLIMFADPKDPANPQKRTGIRLQRRHAVDLAAIVREAALTIIVAPTITPS